MSCKGSTLSDLHIFCYIIMYTDQSKDILKSILNEDVSRVLTGA